MNDLHLGRLICATSQREPSLVKADSGEGSRRSIAIVSPISLYPINHGAARRVWEIAAQLKKRDHRVSILSLGENIGSSNNVCLVSDGILYEELSLLKGSTEPNLLLSDIIQFEYPFFPHMMFVMRVLGKKVILDEHGVEVLYWEDLKKLRSTEDRPRNLRSILASLLQWSPITFFLEFLSIKFANRVIVASQVDCDHLCRIYGATREKLVIIPNIVTSQLSESSGTQEPHSTRTVVFVGSFDHPANLEAADYILNELVPRVSSVANAEFVIAGRHPPISLVNKCANLGVTILGNVGSTQTLVSKSTVAICPIWRGSGTRTKLLEYFALGKAVVSTTKGAEGIAVTNGVNVILKDTADEFAQAIRELLTNDDERRRIGQNALNLVSRKYSWNALRSSLDELYGKERS
jgi:glycosyltransferase involved in cell wall biosynthesis